MVSGLIIKNIPMSIFEENVYLGIVLIVLYFSFHENSDLWNS